MSLGKFLEKCVHTRNHIFSLVFMEHGQNLCLMFILTTLKLGHAGYKIKSQILTCSHCLNQDVFDLTMVEAITDMSAFWQCPFHLGTVKYSRHEEREKKV